MFGAVWAQAELRKVLGAIGARVTEGEVAVGNAGERVDESGRLTEPNLEQEVHEVIATLLADARSAKTSQPATGAARSALTRQATLAGPKKPSSAGATGTAAAYAAADRSTSLAASA